MTAFVSVDELVGHAKKPEDGFMSDYEREYETEVTKPFTGAVMCRSYICKWHGNASDCGITTTNYGNKALCCPICGHYVRELDVKYQAIKEEIIEKHGIQ